MAVAERRLTQHDRHVEKMDIDIGELRSAPGTIQREEPPYYEGSWGIGPRHRPHHHHI